MFSPGVSKGMRAKVTAIVGLRRARHWPEEISHGQGEGSKGGKQSWGRLGCVVTPHMEKPLRGSQRKP